MNKQELAKSFLKAAGIVTEENEAGLDVEKAATALDNVMSQLVKTIGTSSSSAYKEREHLDTAILDVTDRKTPFLDMVSKVRANGLTHSWDMITALGSNDTAVAECGTPVENEATITRYSASVKTYATRVKVCDLAQWGASDYFDVMQTHLQAGIRKIMQDVEKKCFYGNYAGASTDDITGLYKLITDNAAANVIDGSGAALSTTLIDNAIQKIVDQGGMPTHMFMSPAAVRDFQSLWSSYVAINDPGAGTRVGYNVATYTSFAGDIPIVMDPFLVAGSDKPNNPNTDIFILDMNQIKLAETEPMYRLPTNRGLDLAETQAVVWNIALELKVPQYQAILKDVT